MDLWILPGEFSVCKVEDVSEIDLSKEFVFTGKTDTEFSVTCPTDVAPKACKKREDGWKGFRVQGTLKFSLIGILSPILVKLAEYKISVFVVSTYDTDYVFVKKECFSDAVRVLKEAEYHFLNETV